MSIFEYDEELHNKTLFEEGMEEGQKQKANGIARNLLNILDIQTIATTTGLSVEEVDKLAKECQV